ncbi:MAG TPA: amidohydrolase family protein [Bryobacteraceae bacterium]|nr:amidohydrolase family protein [Bryobacteraceae bacterium]
MTGPRVDAHQHFWDVRRFAYPWMPAELRRNFLPEDLAPVLRENRFDGAVTVQASTEDGESDWLLDLADQHSFMLGVVAWVDLTDPRLGDRLDQLQRRPKFRGVRHPVDDEPDNRWLLRAEVLRGLRELERRRIPFDLLVRPRHLPVVRELVDRVPSLPLVIDHIAKPPVATGSLEGWAADLEKVAQIGHMHVKLSGMVTEAGDRLAPEHLRPYLHHVMRLFPPERMMFGSDWPVCKLAGGMSWKRVLATFTQTHGPIPSPVRAEIIGATAVRFYGLKLQEWEPAAA